MKFGFLSALLAAGLLACAAPAGADTEVGDVLDLTPVDAAGLGQSVCPLLAERGQNTADIASTVADQIGRPLGPAALFTGLAISSLCPRAVTSLTDLGF